MDLTVSESMKGGEKEIHHFSHQHPLVFIQDDGFASEASYCFGCDQSLEGPRYGCNGCKYFLHKGCAELELAPDIDHPFHPKHPLTLLPKSPYIGSFECDFCNRDSRGFVYHCDSCELDLHVYCALFLQTSIATNLPTSLHQHHPLLFLPDHNQEIIGDCSACTKPLSGTVYFCLDCPYKKPFNLHKVCGELPLEIGCACLHKECAELPFEISHPCDRMHPLTLLPESPTHPHNCRCYLCKVQWKGFVYSCSLCKVELSLDDYSAPPTITVASHEHPWKLLLRQMSFICDFCGMTGNHTPYLSATCDLLVHRKCISMPRKIMITRHRHVISHSYSLPQNEVGHWICRICYEDVDTRYGSYSCSKTNCSYIAHVHCATDKTIWDGTIVLEDEDESCKETQNESLNLITEVVEETSIGEYMVAIEIKHEYHDHNLRLTFSGDIEDESQCDGCMRPILTPFYSCGECNFFLHKDCAELPREKRHPFHKHLLRLTNSHNEGEHSWCSACHHSYHGFSYQCYNEVCRSLFNYDVWCISLLDTFKHPSHEHSLFLAHDFSTECNGCRRQIFRDGMSYRCMKHCDFTLDILCVTKSLTFWYKYDKHPLTLTYSDYSSPSQHYCDLCENERDPNDWFYYCIDCDNSLHSKCAFGGLRFWKLGSKFNYYRHPHPFTVVKNIWNCPPCKVCGNVCNGVALQCKESECNFIVHWGCIWKLTK